jgi:hypothetical protein
LRQGLAEEGLMANSEAAATHLLRANVSSLEGTGEGYDVAGRSSVVYELVEISTGGNEATRISSIAQKSGVYASLSERRSIKRSALQKSAQEYLEELSSELYSRR